jgi:hypothetical protein
MLKKNRAAPSPSEPWQTRFRRRDEKGRNCSSSFLPISKHLEEFFSTSFDTQLEAGVATKGKLVVRGGGSDIGDQVVRSRSGPSFGQRIVSHV